MRVAESGMRDAASVSSALYIFGSEWRHVLIVCHGRPLLPRCKCAPAAGGTAMLTALVGQPREFEVRKVPIPVPGDDEVLFKGE